MTNQERLTYLLEIVETSSNRGRLTHSWVAETISLAVADAVFDAINSQSVPTAMRYATGIGIDTSAALWKMQATAIAGVDEALAPHLVTLRDYEIEPKPRWQTLPEYSVEPTIQTIMIEAAIQAMRVKLNNAAASLGSEYTDSLTVAELETLIAAVIVSTDGLVP